jgi:hypothetical protein
MQMDRSEYSKELTERGDNISVKAPAGQSLDSTKAPSQMLELRYKMTN